MSSVDSAPPLARAPEIAADAVGRTCLVTGGSGYLARTLVARLLAMGNVVRTIDLRPDSPDPRVSHLAADLRDYDAIAPAFVGVDTVFHTAAIISTVDADNAQPALRRTVFGVNVVGTENVLRAAAAAKVGAFVHTSSFNVVMDHPIDGGDETLPYATRSNDLYTVTKIAAEKLALAADDAKGMRTCALRPGGIWGPGRGAMMIDAFVEQLDKGAFKATIGNGNTLLDNTHVENVVDAQLLAARALRRPEATAAGRAYFVTDDERFDAMDWFRPLVEGLGHAFPSVRVPGALMMRVARALELAHKFGSPPPLITRRSIRNLTEGAHFSIARARAELGYEPRYRRAHLAEIVAQRRAAAAAAPVGDVRDLATGARA
jgi:3beta-hydroxy-Delta5-steroid dehydrogenase / steroid Delta-isomerase